MRARAVSIWACPPLFNQFFGPRVTLGKPSENDPTDQSSETGRFTLIWILVLILAILAIVGGLALSKFLFILLVVAVIVALLGARSTA